MEFKMQNRVYIQRWEDRTTQSRRKEKDTLTHDVSIAQKLKKKEKWQEDFQCLHGIALSAQFFCSAHFAPTADFIAVTEKLNTAYEANALLILNALFLYLTHKMIMLT